MRHTKGSEGRCGKIHGSIRRTEALGTENGSSFALTQFRYIGVVWLVIIGGIFFIIQRATKKQAERRLIAEKA